MSGRRASDIASLLRAVTDVKAQFVKLRKRNLEIYNETSAFASVPPRQPQSKDNGHVGDAGHTTDHSRKSPTFNISSRQPRPDTVIPKAPDAKEAVSKYGPWNRDTRQQAAPQSDPYAGIQNRRPDRLPTGSLRSSLVNSSMTQAHENGQHNPLVQAQGVLASPVERETREVQLNNPSERDQPKDPNLATTSQEGHSYAAKDTEDVDALSSIAGPLDQRGDDHPASSGQTSDDVYARLFHSPRIAKNIRSGFETQRKQHKNDLSVDPRSSSKPDAISCRDAMPQDAARANDLGTIQSKLDLEHSSTDGSKSTQQRSASPKQSELPALLESIGAESGSTARLKESKVPSSRLGRIWQYSGLATSMAFGAIGEGLRRVSGPRNSQSGSLMMSEPNMKRLVSKLSRMRGAALKLGQMLSFQDSNLLPAPIGEVLQRVQDSADYMPASQRNSVLASSLGSDWRELFSSFDEMPMAAASIGQVHGAVLKETNSRVAVKVQYPGVADSIDSDLNNLSLLLTASRLLPKGLYLDKTIANARSELAWECDYVREAEAAKRFKALLVDEQETFDVPTVFEAASAAQVLTMARMEGTAVTKIRDLDQAQKDWIGAQILRLCLREMAEFRYMQTDPNWTNFLYNPARQKLELLDFGASREYPLEFIDPYLRTLEAAARGDRDTCRELSIQLGYLTGYESKTMLDAHVTSIFTLAEPFGAKAPDIYHFQNQTITDRIRELIPTMLRERLAPPPEETYSLHRKLSGAFLLCAKLGSRVRCREMFESAMREFRATANNAG